MNLGPTVEQRPELTYYVYGNVQNRCNELRAHMARVPDAGTNVALISHSAITGDSTFAPTVDSTLCSVLDATARSSAQVYKPMGDGGYILIINNVAVSAWSTLP